MVTHQESNIEITGELLQCLRPGAWLNDEVITLAFVLLCGYKSKLTILMNLKMYIFLISSGYQSVSCVTEREGTEGSPEVSKMPFLQHILLQEGLNIYLVFCFFNLLPVTFSFYSSKLLLPKLINKIDLPVEGYICVEGW